MNIDVIIDCQNKINSLMSRYEEASRELLECPMDDILGLTEKRQSISEEITYCDNQIRKECVDDQNALSAYLNRCDRSGLSEEYAKIFDLRQEFNSMAFRVREMDPEIRERIIIMRNEIIEKIKENNSGQNAKAAKYAQVGMPEGDKLFFPENKKMI